MSEVGTSGWYFPSDVTLADGALYEGGPRPYCAISRVQTINDATWTTVSWDTEYHDNDSMWTSGSPTLISPSTPGTYYIKVSAQRNTHRTDYRLGALTLYGNVGAGRYVARYGERLTEVGSSYAVSNTVQGFWTTLNHGTCDWTVDYYQDNTANVSSSITFRCTVVRVGGSPSSWLHL